jgi:Flp pilus assembly CpaF family ATPase
MADHSDQNIPHHSTQEQQTERDSLPIPQLVYGRSGTRMYSLAALQERIEAEFLAEYGDDSAALREADTPTRRLKLILDSVNYVLGVESVHLEATIKADLIARVHSNLFGYAVLDAFLTDERVTTIAIHGPKHVSVRLGHGDLERTGVSFDDDAHLRAIMKRILGDAGAELRDDEPIIETGLLIGDRRVSISLTMPPISPYVHVDMRLHPAQAPTLDELQADEFMTPEAGHMLGAILRSRYGFIVVGEPESGKTTLLNALLKQMPLDGTVAVERTGELQLPDGIIRRMARWPVGIEPGITFGQQIDAALSDQPSVLVLDEVRADEPLTILPLLTQEPSPRQIWSVRGVPDAKRLQSGLGMLARRADMARSEEMVRALYDRLPFVITVHNIQGKLRLFSIAEWQSRADSDYPDYVMLTQYRDGASRPTGAVPARWLD